ncbi:MAG: hypothetical protein WD768_06660 [Phycisphaeraceae bacterium]
MNTHARLLRLVTTLALMLAFASSLIAQDGARSAAHFAPADAAVYIEINDIAALRADWESDPLANFIQKHLPGPSPAGWKAVQLQMGLSGDKIIDNYFGKSAAIVFMKTGGEQPGIVITKVADKDISYGIERLKLNKTGTIGSFTTYTTKNSDAQIAIGGGWVVVADATVKAGVTKLLEAGTGSLADSAEFKSWSAKLPTDRFGTVFIRPGNDDTHALGISRKGRDLSLEYRGSSQDFSPLFDLLGDGAPLDFGPLPKTTIAAINANIKPTPGPNPKQMNRLFPGKSFEKDILPYLGSPTLLFLGEVPGDQFKENPGLSVPVLGVAIQLRDKKVAEDLNKAMNGLMIVLNFAAAGWELPEVVVRDSEHGGTKFHVADVGALLAARTERPELKAINLAYGRVGDWYILCTQDKFFTQCIDADRDPSLSLASFAEFKAMPLKAHERPILTAILRPSALAAHVNTWLTHWEKVRPQVVQQATQASQASDNPEVRLVQFARIAVGLMDHYQSVSVQAYREGEGMAAKLDLIRK